MVANTTRSIASVATPACSRALRAAATPRSEVAVPGSTKYRVSTPLRSRIQPSVVSMIRASISLVTRFCAISLPLPTTTALAMPWILLPGGLAGEGGAGLWSARAEARRRGARVRGGRDDAPPSARRQIGRRLLLPQGLHPRVNARGRRVPPGRARDPEARGRARGREQGHARGGGRVLPEPRSALHARGRRDGRGHQGLRGGVAPPRSR